MKSLSLSIITLLVLFLTACGGETQEPETIATADPVAAEEAPAFESGEEFKAQLETALDSYFQLSAALVETSSSTAAEIAPVLISSMQAVVSEDLDDDARAFYSEAFETITIRANTISQLTDVEEQRYHFEYLSESMIDLVEAFGPLSYTVYVQRCPMVRDGSADWLSRESGILNPYHGDRMLRCGSIVREI
ncbi:MAG: DUF3347 domain-containing protein [Balneolia bacterium]|nr:DUF3347 domain-containing protein [Balneolia bacterium]